MRELNVKNPASLAADLLGLIAALGALCLSWLHHRHSEQPSTLLAIFLAALSLLSIARVRTFWFIPGATGAATVLSLTLVVILCALLLESLGKRGSLRHPEKLATSGPEPFTGFWSIVGFVWLLGTVRAGYRKILTVDDLPALDYRLGSNGSHAELNDAWAKGEK